MGNKIVLIDGHSILNRAFYGVPDLTTAKGLHTNAVYGFLNIMLKILEEEKPEYLMVAFDVKKPTFRHERYREYKGTRKPMPEELREQVPVIQDVLRAMHIPVIMQGGYEADDILGTIAKRAEKEGMEVSLVSGDRDLLQLASDKILIRIPKTKRGGTEIEDYHADDVLETYSITPAQVIDMKGLMGDTADNIPGVPGIGEKTALKILTAFPSVEEAYEHLEEIEPKRVRELLRTHRELAFLSKELATIKVDVEFSFAWEEAKCEGLFTAEAYDWIKKLELKSLEKHFDGSVVSKAHTSDLSCQIITEKEKLELLLKEIQKTKPERVGVGFLGDEWSNAGAVRKKSGKKAEMQMSLSFDDDEVSISDKEQGEDYPFYGLSIYVAGDTVFCIFANETFTTKELIRVYQEIEEAAGQICLIDWKNTMHNVALIEKADADTYATGQQAFKDQSVEELEWLFSKIFDVSIGAYLLNPLQNSYEVEDLARDYLDANILSFEEAFGKKVRLAELSHEETFIRFLAAPEMESTFGKKCTTYLGNLAYVAKVAAEEIQKELEAKEMYALLQEIEMPTAYFLYQLERIGVQVDRQELEEISSMLEQKILALETDIYDLAGEEFNINSPKQLGVILFEKLKLPFAKKTKTGYSTSADILEKLRHEDPIVERVLEYRQVSKLKSTYADGLPVFIDEDMRIHGKFNQTITATGRISSTDPNLQNIPIRMELGRELRKVFRPREGCVFLDADYSQIELRLLAHMSGDKQMLEAYQNALDIHRSTASKVFHTPYEEVSELERRNAKAVNFGIVYGISSFGLSQDLGVTKKEAQQFIDQYFATYPAIKEYIDGLVSEAKEKGYATTMYGRKRPVPELSSSNFMQRSFGERVAMNSPIQGTAADIIKIAMIRVAKRLMAEELEAKIVLQVHDELLVETPFAEVEQVQKILKEEMEQAADLSLPLEVEVMQGKDWKEAH